MAGLTKEHRRHLLEALRFDAGQAEAASDEREDFLPILEHLRALEPDVVLVVGDRGSGKTKLKNVATDVDLREAVLAYAPRLRAPSGKVEWLTGWPLGTDGPDPSAWSEFTAHHPGDRHAMDLWAAYLVRLVAERLDAKGLAATTALRDIQGGNAEEVYETFVRRKVEAMLALDRLDNDLGLNEHWLFVAYDELDTIALQDWRALGIAVRSLVSFWATYARRWKRIRPKVFLRTDFYKHNREIAGADIAKLSANRVELGWSDRNLYGALIQHIANASPDLFQYVSKAVSLRRVAGLGAVPDLSVAADARPFVNRLVGEHMGANKKKGASFTWILDHLRDGNGKVTPRALMWLFEFAAEHELGDMRGTGTQILHPVALRNALDNVSGRHVQLAASSELKWLWGLRVRLAHDREVPWSRKELERLLARDFNKSWSNDGTDVRPPGVDHRELLGSLIELGVIRVRGDDSFDVPDIYLAGLELTRRGGVAKY